MGIIGAHVLVYSSEPEALRATLRDVLGWKHVRWEHEAAGDDWLIFALPPAELGIHPAEGPSFEAGVRHQLTLMCDDITSTVAELRAKGIRVSGEPQEEEFGITVMIVLPGDVEVLLYEPHHPLAVEGSRD